MGTGIFGLPRPLVTSSGVELTYKASFVGSDREEAMQVVVDNKTDILEALQEEFDESEADYGFGDISSLTAEDIVKGDEVNLGDSLEAYQTDILITVSIDGESATTNVISSTLQPITDDVLVSSIPELSDGISEGDLNITTLDTPILG